MIGLIKSVLVDFVRTMGRGCSLYKRFCKPNGYEWAEHLVRWGALHSIGKGVWINIRYGKKLDSVGPIDICDNCFIGYGAIVMPRVTIGPDSIVAAGAVVTKDVPPGVVVRSNPAKVICTMEELVKKVEERCTTYPWMDLIKQRSGVYDPALEPTLVAMRAQHFFGEQPNG